MERNRKYGDMVMKKGSFAERLSQIAEGWRNSLFPPEEKKAIIEEVGAYRMSLCMECPYNSVNTGRLFARPDVHCTRCGCTLASRTKCLSCSCPLPVPKWKAVVSEGEDDM